MTNSADPDQLASEEANWSASTLFAKTGHVVFSKRRVNCLSEHDSYRMLYFTVCIFVKQAWANSVDPDETPLTRRLIRVYTVCIRPPILDIIMGSKMHVFKF